MKLKNSYSSWQEAVRQIVLAFNLRKVSSFTCDTSTTTTTVTDSKVGADSVVLFTPVTANAAAESIYITNGTGEFTVTHSSDVTTDRTFRYTVED